MSSSSSGLFAGPLSYHTADTSVDFGSIALSSVLSSSLSSVSIGMGGQPAKTGAEEAGDQEGGSSTMMLPAFNTDGDVSDDDHDSFVGLQRHQTGDEEDLLFDDGYGVDGQQLPGLDDMLAAPAPVVKLRKPRLSVFSSCEDLQHAYNIAPVVEREYEQSISSDILSHAGPFQTHRPRSSRRHSPASGSETKRATASNPDYIGGLTHTTSSRKHRPHAIYYGLHRLASNMGDETIEEENIEKSDGVSADRLRKEVKSEHRASIVSMASESHVYDLLKTIASDSTVAGSDDGEDSRHNEAELSDDEKSADDAPCAADREDADIDQIREAFPSMSSGVEEAQVYAS
ncbi:hypothetical protein CMQ_2724 [Grosmannia clavigera kw1407]|uniref:Uncharacterized protein n=1 Tax=Grosmannia clavigera (strain kw1407 / UAMH 11150) TaxID=655863 RepID=F0XHY9_GROCL|nr:uncharacterized protein CMQ_2724 [Grosmannia clavigera kw1407]EFX02795.1 hypothetical protein CMQ_2724 [Grosmannia clavigera kw1407]